ncbi:MAG: hypothetical protein QOI58_28 [Thermoanaerobaculia bacterium]|jgi:NTE family protein|nr:hypothetical protein [Thermoanaerobaculia bacterium]
MNAGLVLTGGGARGAYQAGAIARIVESPFLPALLAGSGIGAVNAALFASARDPRAGAASLRAAWRDLGGERIVVPSAAALATLAKAIMTRSPTELATIEPLFDPEPVERVLRRYVTPAAVRCGLPVWVTVARAAQLAPKFDKLASTAIVAATSMVEWVRLNDVDDDEAMIEYLLASVALPFAFPSRTIGDYRYASATIRENVPVQALAQNGCTDAVVVHLQDGSVWRRAQFPELSVIEIRPREPFVDPESPLVGWLRSTADFSGARIAELDKRGYRDADAVLTAIKALSAQGASRRRARTDMLAALEGVSEPGEDE